MGAITDNQVMAYAGLVDSLARRMTGYSDAEYDDLVQEGYIAVFLAHKAGAHPSKAICRGRMLNWCRYLRRLQNNDAVAYEELLPMEHHAIDEL